MNKFKIPPFSNNDIVMLLSKYFEVNFCIFGDELFFVLVSELVEESNQKC